MDRTTMHNDLSRVAPRGYFWQAVTQTHYRNAINFKANLFR